MNNKNKEIGESIIAKYIKQLNIYDEAYRSPAYAKNIKVKVLIAMFETAYKLHLACADLRKEIK